MKAACNAEPAKRVPDAEPGERVTGAGAPLQRPDCVAVHVALELRNVGKNYPFERSRRFPGIQSNSSHRDHSRLSCVAGDTQLGPGSCAESNGGPPSRRKPWRGLR